MVHSENGFIAVVSNNMNKAYFLKENDPVFNGYVVKITGRLHRFPGNAARPAGQDFYARSSEEDYDSGSVAVGKQIFAATNLKKDFEETHGGENGLAWGDRGNAKATAGHLGSAAGVRSDNDRGRG